MVPWVHDRHAGAGEILAVAGGDDQIMLERRRRDPGIALGTRVGDVERSASAGDGQVERQEGVGEHRLDMLAQPAAQQCAWGASCRSSFAMPSSISMIVITDR